MKCKTTDGFQGITIAVMFLFYLATLQVNAQTNELNHSYSIHSKAFNGVKRNSLQAPVLFASNLTKQKKAQSNILLMPPAYTVSDDYYAWNRAYNRNLGKAIARLVIGAGFLGGGAGLLAIGVPDMINPRDNSNQFYNPNTFITGIEMVSVGGAMVLTGLILTPTCKKYFQLAGQIKRDRARRVFDISYYPSLNYDPGTHCAASANVRISF